MSSILGGTTLRLEKKAAKHRKLLNYSAIQEFLFFPKMQKKARKSTFKMPHSVAFFA